jgi:hypothetical protein
LVKKALRTLPDTDGDNWTGQAIATQCLSRSLRGIIAGALSRQQTLPAWGSSLANHPGIP